MAQTIKLKRSANSTLTSGQGIPTTSNLELGEVAINTYHGKMYIKKNDGSESIVEVGAADNTKLPLAGGTMTGALNMGGNNITSPSNFTLDVATNINLDAGTNGSIYLKDDGVTYGRLYRSGSADNFNIKSTANNADIRLQGKNNLGTEITALTLDMSASGAAIFNDQITLGGNLVHAGNFTLDVAGDITLDADGRDVFFADGGTNYFQVYNDISNNVILNSVIQDKDIKFTGNDGGSTITALTLDMSNAGTATFNHDIKLFDDSKAIFGTDQDLTIQHTGSNGFIQNTTGDLRFDVAGNIKLDTDDGTILFVDGGTEVGRFLLDNNDFKIKSTQSDADIIFQGNDGGSGITALTLDMSEGGSATFANNVTISGNLEVTGTTTQTGSIITNSNFTGLSDANSANTTDFGFYGKYVESSTTKYAGMYYDASTDNTFKLFCDTQTAPTTTVNESATGYALANLNIAGLTTTGNVGIGNSNPSTPLVVQSNSSAQGITILGRSDDISQLDFDENDGTIIAGFQARTTDFRIRSIQNIPLLFLTNNTERMRIDSNGSVYIASTSDSGSNRHFFQHDGFVRHKRANLVGVFDRDNTDGDILKIRKDGSDVGTFGSNSGQFLIDSNSSNIVIQANSGSSSVITRGILRPLVDNTDDLGQSNRRFKDLHLSGVANVGAVVTTSSVRSFDGSATAASFNSINDINTGLFFPASNNLAVTTDGTERLRIDALGRVGIGTTAPSAPLHVGGDGRIAIFGDTSFDDKYIEFREGGTTGFRMGLRTNFVDSSGDILLTCGDDKGFGIVTNTTSAWSSVATSAVNFYISEGGNVGIGTAAPAAKLHVVGPAARPTDLASVDTASTAQFQADASNAHSLYIAENASGALIQVNDGATNSTAAKPLALQPFGGNVGIGTGTTAPSANLEVQDSSGSMIMVDDTNGRFIKIRSANSGSQNANISSYSGLYLGGSDNASHVLISNSGNVGIGTSAPTTAKLVVQGADAGDLLHLHGATGTNTRGLKISLGTDGATNQIVNFDSMQANGILAFKTAGTERMRIHDGGNVGIGTTSPSGAKLHVAGGVKATDLIAHDSTGINLQTDEGTKRLVVADSGVITFNQAYSFPTADGSTGQALITDGSGNISFGSVSAGAASSMVDADGDTKIQVEEASDDDTIRFDVAGTEKVTLNSSNFSIESGGFRVDDPGGNYPFRVTQYGYMTSRGASITQLNATGDHANVPLSVLADVNSTRTASYVEIGDIGSAGNRFKIDNSGRVGIGTTSPGKTLTVSGTFQSTGEAFFSHFDNITNSSRMRDNLRLNFGTARTFAIVGNSTNMHIRNSSTDVMTFDTNNRVGIGTTSPTSTLEVAGTVRTDLIQTRDLSANTFINLDMDTGGTVGSNNMILGAVSNMEFLVDTNNNGTGGAFIFKRDSNVPSSATEIMRLTEPGNLGIGTNSPTAILETVSATSGGAPVFRAGTADFLGAVIGTQGGGFAVESGNYFSIWHQPYANRGTQTNLTERLRIDTSGQVGIGTISPNYLLDVEGTGSLFRIHATSGSTVLQLQVSDTTSINDINFGDTGATARGQIRYRHNGDSLAMSTAGVERLRINSSGQVGIGTAAPGSTLDVHGNTNLGSDNIGAQYTTTLSGFSVSDGSSLYGSYGSLILNSNSNYTSSSRPYMITNALGANKFAIISGTDANTDPTIGTNGAVTSGNVRVAIDNSGRVGIGTTSPAKELDVVGTVRAVDASSLQHQLRPTQLISYGTDAVINAQSAGDDVLLKAQGNTRLIVTAEGNVGIGTTSPGAKLQVEDAGIDTTTTSTTATTQVAIDTFAAATFRSAEFTIQVKNSTDSTYHLTKVLLIHDGTTPAITEYGTIFTGSAAEATFDADISSGNVRLLATPASTDSMTFKVVRHCITV